MCTAVTFGNFDGVHLGHAAIFSAAKNLAKNFGLRSVVATFNPHPVIYFSKKRDFLIYSQKEKELLLAEFFDSVHTFQFDKEFANLSPEEFLKLLHDKFRPLYIVTGPKCRFGKGACGGIDDLKKYEEQFQYKTIVVDPLKGGGIFYSSTAVRNFLKHGMVEQASEILGRKYSICGTVKKNMGLGTKIGFPTINIHMPPELLKPRLGVYFGTVDVDKVTYSGIINIGRRPTVAENSDITLEMHIFGFDRMIYDKQVKIFFCHFIRDETKFASLADLIKQINIDVESVQG
jgi:riboflavin kinase/FMN adenylyltransferase